MPYTTLTPRLVVGDADRALAFYAAAFGATPGMRIATPDGHVVHAEVDLAGMRFSITEPDGPNRDPRALGGTAVLLTLICEDPDDVAERVVANGGEVLIPVDDRFYGKREGRVADPFGHEWILSKPLVALSVEELTRRTAESIPRRRQG